MHTLKKQAGTSFASVPPPADAGPVHIYIKADKRFIQVQLDDIYCLESPGDFVKVWAERRYLPTARTLSSFEDQLPAELFLRIHKSYILNRKFVHYIEGNTIRLKNGKELPLGKNYRPAVKQLLGNDESR